jgi:hypothetical protein
MQVLQSALETGSGADRFIHVALPLMRTRGVHADYVDSVVWHGDCLLSKSVTDEAVLWRLPITHLDDTLALSSLPKAAAGLLKVASWALPHTSIWFLKISTDPEHSVAACGSKQGRVYLWQLPEEGGEVGGGRAEVVHVTERSGAAVRSVALHDGEFVLAGLSDGRLILMRGTLAKRRN